MFISCESPRGGIGRRDGFKIRCLNGRVSSSLTEGTIPFVLDLSSYVPIVACIDAIVGAWYKLKIERVSRLEKIMKKPGKIRRIATAISKLLKDKEDTTQVFVILEALAGKSGERSFKRFKKSPHATKILSAEKPLMSYLKDREWLAGLPEGSLGQAYYKFTEVEQITADGLVEASEQGRTLDIDLPPQAIVYQERQRDAHDLWHVVTGYGRDPLGELALLAVTWRQTGNIGFLLIIGVGYRVIGKAAPGLKIGRVLREGFRTGAKAQWLPAADWETLLTRPLSEVRETLTMPAPEHYRQTVLKIPELQTPGFVAAE